MEDAALYTSYKGTISSANNTATENDFARKYHRPKLPTILANKKIPIKSGSELLYPDRYSNKSVNNGRLTMRNNEFYSKKVKEKDFHVSLSLKGKSKEERSKDKGASIFSSSMFIVKIK
jgi:hypothetical protein